ncbi:MAG: hypothetical protein CFE24_00830 [Flavobacterium sp. BFFFF2]|nr:MAG: hypothetical protein CFE24_00830 [Flavobacterium sp. BFFFF2]
MQKIIIIGSGNVAFHLAKQFLNATDFDLIGYHSPHGINKSSDFYPTCYLSSQDVFNETDCVFIVAVNDDQVALAAKDLPASKLVVHTSGSLPWQVLPDSMRRGVLYPLQTFSKNRVVQFDQVPLFVETEFSEDLPLLKSLAKELSPIQYESTFELRQHLHVAAVFSCNFVNHCYAIAQKLCKEQSLPFDILRPLIEETAEKIKTLDPVQAQTGPAIRHDQKTIDRHLSLIDNPQWQLIYQEMSDSIQSLKFKV